MVSILIVLGTDNKSKKYLSTSTSKTHLRQEAQIAYSKNVLGDKSKTGQDLLSLNLRYRSCFRCPKISTKALKNAVVSHMKACSLYVTLSFDHDLNPRDHDLDPRIHLRLKNFKSLTENSME